MHYTKICRVIELQRYSCLVLPLGRGEWAASCHCPGRRSCHYSLNGRCYVGYMKEFKVMG